MSGRTQAEHVQQTIWGLKMYRWYNILESVAGVARKMNAAGRRTAYGELWNEANLNAFAKEHEFSRDPLENLIPLVVTVDEPGLFEMAVPELADVLSVKDGMRNARVISRYIEKGDPEHRKRLWKAVEDDPEVRAEVIRFAPLMLDHPWAEEDYQEFLDHARVVEAGLLDHDGDRTVTL